MAELVYAPVVVAAKGLFKGLDLRLEVRGSENVPRTGGAVLASNHVSYLDFIFRAAKKLVSLVTGRGRTAPQPASRLADPVPAAGHDD